MSTFLYCMKQGIINICRNVLFSLASTATISACIFLFCLFFALVANVRHIADVAQTTVGITVFFDEDMTQEEIQALGEEIGTWEEIDRMEYVSGDQAWENFKQEYFQGMEDLAEGFAQDNPLAGSSSYTIFLKHIQDQEQVVERLQAMEGVRRVNYSNDAVAGLSSAGRIVGILSAVIIGVLLAVAVFLISNTISVAAAFRRRENEIMRLIGATDFMVRAPFVVEGLLLGLAGALIPLIAMYFLYQKAMNYVNVHFQLLTGLFQPLALERIFPSMTGAALGLGLGVGFFVSFFTIQKHLRV